MSTSSTGAATRTFLVGNAGVETDPNSVPDSIETSVHRLSEKFRLSFDDLLSITRLDDIELCRQRLDKLLNDPVQARGPDGSTNARNTFRDNLVIDNLVKIRELAADFNSKEQAEMLAMILIDATKASKASEIADHLQSAETYIQRVRTTNKPGDLQEQVRAVHRREEPVEFKGISDLSIRQEELRIYEINQNNLERIGLGLDLERSDQRRFTRLKILDALRNESFLANNPDSRILSSLTRALEGAQITNTELKLDDIHKLRDAIDSLRLDPTKHPVVFTQICMEMADLLRHDELNTANSTDLVWKPIISWYFNQPSVSDERIKLIAEGICSSLGPLYDEDAKSTREMIVTALEAGREELLDPSKTSLKELANTRPIVINQVMEAARAMHQQCPPVIVKKAGAFDKFTIFGDMARRNKKATALSVAALTTGIVSLAITLWGDRGTIEVGRPNPKLEGQVSSLTENIEALHQKIKDLDKVKESEDDHTKLINELSKAVAKLNSQLKTVTKAEDIKTVNAHLEQMRVDLASLQSGKDKSSVTNQQTRKLAKQYDQLVTQVAALTATTEALQEVTREALTRTSKVDLSKDGELLLSTSDNFMDTYGEIINEHQGFANQARAITEAIDAAEEDRAEANKKKFYALVQLAFHTALPEAHLEIATSDIEENFPIDQRNKKVTRRLSAYMSGDTASQTYRVVYNESFIDQGVGTNGIPPVLPAMQGMGRFISDRGILTKLSTLLQSLFQNRAEYFKPSQDLPRTVT